MIFRDIFLQLVLGASLCIAAITPYDRSKIVTPRRTPPEDKNPELQVSPLKRIKRTDSEWYLGLITIGNTVGLHALDTVTQFSQSVTAKNLTSKLTERVRFSLKGDNNKGIYTLRSEYKVSGANARTYSKETVIVKFIAKHNEPEAACEVRTLERFGFFIEAGRVTTEKDEYAAIVMVKQSGEPLETIDAWINAPVAQKRAIVQDMKNRVHDQIYGWVTNLQIIHVDFDKNNVLAKIVKDEATNDIRLEHIEIVDYGLPGIWPTTLKVTDKEIFTTWFEARWNFLWKDLIETLDNEEKGKEKRMQKRRLSLTQTGADRGWPNSLRTLLVHG
ncbi:hypothetical protein GGU10DRAFT_371419 [Lentinula aff. detonsa]|uniref:Protein kinase domain-containing protein n=1 Tax=Lentinula aff. detonsa TaxID=2804958 RepID=A0AA38NSJ9_9AGAR|nr:hypothetical protein GGU10DRAFT_371419 [Lentinula aff. detonsa]